MTRTSIPLWSLMIWLLVVTVFISLARPHSSFAKDPVCEIKPPYTAPPYIPPMAETPESRLRLEDNGDGTITDPDSRLMWAKADSYADLGKCLNYYDAKDYVKNLKTSGHADWRIPTIQELTTIYDPTKENVMAWDHNPDYPLALDEKFADGAAYWYWSADCGETELTQCCARSFYFVKGLVNLRHFDLCNNGGVRAVRNLP